jgi:Immunity protein 45
VAAEILHRIRLSGVALTPELLAGASRERIVAINLRGGLSRHGQVFADTTIVANVDSILDGIEAIQRARAVHPGLIEDASLHIDYEYDAQCNLEVSTDEVAALAQAGSALTISCWEAPAVSKAFAVPVAAWRPLSEIEATPLWKGTVLRFPAKWPHEAFVDHMLVSDQGCEGDKLKLLATTGHKGGSMNILTAFPPEAYVSGAVAISSDWLKANWCEWVYDACEMSEVYVSTGYATPIDTAGNMTL